MLKRELLAQLSEIGEDDPVTFAISESAEMQAEAGDILNIESVEYNLELGHVIYLLHEADE